MHSTGVRTSRGSKVIDGEEEGNLLWFRVSKKRGGTVIRIIRDVRLVRGGRSSKCSKGISVSKL